MSTLSFTSVSSVMRSAHDAIGPTEAQRMWRTAALASLSIRVIQGFIYWGGGSRRFIYAPSKLNPDAPTWMALVRELHFYVSFSVGEPIFLYFVNN